MSDPFAPTPPDRYQGLAVAYWLKKWLPDPPPYALDELRLAQAYDQLALIQDDGLRTGAQDQLGGFLKDLRPGG